MKGFSLLLLIVSSLSFAASHPSCEFFEKGSTPLFKVSKSNGSKSLYVNLKLDDQCLYDSNTSLNIYFKNKSGVCTLPSFTYIRRNLGFKNYSDMKSKILKKNSRLVIPSLKKVLKSRTAKYIGFTTSKNVNGCNAEAFVKYKKSTLSFNHIYQEVNYISVQSVHLLKTLN